MHAGGDPLSRPMNDRRPWAGFWAFSLSRLAVRSWRPPRLSDTSSPMVSHKSLEDLLGGRAPGRVWGPELGAGWPPDLALSCASFKGERSN